MKIMNRVTLFLGSMLLFALSGCGVPGNGGIVLDAPELSLAVSGRTMVTLETELSAGNSKQLRVSCPEGMKALGAGWSVLDGTNAIMAGIATYFAPAWDGSGWLVNARPKYYSNAEWKLRVTVICAPESSLSGYQVLISETAAAVTGSRQIIVNSPEGKIATGAGWGVLDPTGVILAGEATCFLPRYDGSGWLTNAENRGYFTEWKLKGFLICVDKGSLEGYEIVSVDSETSAFPVKQIEVECPEGNMALSAGWGVLDETGAYLPGTSLYSQVAWDGSGWLTNAMDYATRDPEMEWKLRVRLISCD